MTGIGTGICAVGCGTLRITEIVVHHKELEPADPEGKSRARLGYYQIEPIFSLLIINRIKPITSRKR